MYPSLPASWVGLLVPGGLFPARESYVDGPGGKKPAGGGRPHVAAGFLRLFISSRLVFLIPDFFFRFLMLLPSCMSRVLIFVLSCVCSCPVFVWSKVNLVKNENVYEQC